MKLIDLTHKIEDLLPEYPGDEETRLVNTRKLKTDGYTNHRLHIDMHSGTHIDSPCILSSQRNIFATTP